MDTRTSDYCNLLVVDGTFLQVCRLECRGVTHKGIGGIITKPEEITESHLSLCSDWVSCIQIYPKCIMVHLRTNAAQTWDQNADYDLSDCHISSVSLTSSTSFLALFLSYERKLCLNNHTVWADVDKKNIALSYNMIRNPAPSNYTHMTNSYTSV